MSTEPCHSDVNCTEPMPHLHVDREEMVGGCEGTEPVMPYPGLSEHNDIPPFNVPLSVPPPGFISHGHGYERWLAEAQKECDKRNSRIDAAIARLKLHVTPDMPSRVVVLTSADLADLLLLLGVPDG